MVPICPNYLLLLLQIQLSIHQLPAQTPPQWNIYRHICTDHDSNCTAQKPTTTYTVHTNSLWSVCTNCPNYLLPLLQIQLSNHQLPAQTPSHNGTHRDTHARICDSNRSSVSLPQLDSISLKHNRKKALYLKHLHSDQHSQLLWIFIC